MTVEEFDKKFDDGEDISEYLDMSSIRKPNLEPKRKIYNDLVYYTCCNLCCKKIHFQ
jgi:hypothetical protein